MPENVANELLRKFSNYVNGSNSHDHKEFIKAFSRQHPTLQQSMMRTMLATIEAVASPDYRVDGRNQGSKDMAIKLIKGYKHIIGEEFKLERYENKLKESDISYLESDTCLPSKYLGFV